MALTSPSWWLFLCGLSWSWSRCLARTVSVPDLHGDFGRCVRILQHAGLINAEKQWIGGDAKLVQTGDIVDRGDDAKEIYDLFRRLWREAKDAGGEVVNLLGNHELMNIQKDFSYVSRGDKDHWQDRTNEWSATGDFGEWVRTWPVAKKVGEVLFSHAGVSAELLSARDLDKINRDAKQAIANQRWGHPYLEENGPLWTRLFSEEDQSPTVSQKAESRDPALSWFASKVGILKKILGIKKKKMELTPLCEEVRTVLEKTRTKRMVVGHTIQEDGVRSACGGRLLLGDTAVSAAYDDPDDPDFQTTTRVSYMVHEDGGSTVAVYPDKAEPDQRQTIVLVEPGSLIQQHAFVSVDELGQIAQFADYISPGRAR